MGDYNGEQSTHAFRRDNGATSYEAAVRETERIMLQMVQTAIGLIGFGITIHAFLNNGALKDIDAAVETVARRVGLALLCLGLVQLGWGVWSQGRYLRVLSLRQRSLNPGRPAGYRYRPISTFVVAGLLFVIGVSAFVSLLVRSIV